MVSKRNPLQLGDQISVAPAFLAPMSGVTDLSQRQLAVEFGAGLVVSEIIAAEWLTSGDPAAAIRTEGQGIHPHVVQLAGRDPYWMGEAARMVEQAGAQAIDINMGCPCKRVTSGLSGSALMRDLDQALALIDATLAATPLPVTVKMRLGWDHDNLNAPELARRAEKAGVHWVTVHGRTRQQFYKGTADWRAIRAVSDAVSIPVIANGDILSFDDIDTCLQQSGADAVMIGRATTGRPWFVGQAARYLASGEREADPNLDVIVDLACRHYEAALAHHGVFRGSKMVRKHLVGYMDPVLRADDMAHAALRETILTSDDPRTVLRGLQTYFDEAEREQAA